MSSYNYHNVLVLHDYITFFSLVSFNIYFAISFSAESDLVIVILSGYGDIIGTVISKLEDVFVRSVLNIRDSDL